MVDEPLVTLTVGVHLTCNVELVLSDSAAWDLESHSFMKVPRYSERSGSVSIANTAHFVCLLDPLTG